VQNILNISERMLAPFPKCIIIFDLVKYILLFLSPSSNMILLHIFIVIYVKFEDNASDSFEMMER
jgi:hypothetical protein